MSEKNMLHIGNQRFLSMTNLEFQSFERGQQLVQKERLELENQSKIREAVAAHSSPAALPRTNTDREQQQQMGSASATSSKGGDTNMKQAKR